MVVSGFLCIFAPKSTHKVSTLMKFVRLTIAIIMLISSSLLFADEADDIRQSLPNLKGEALLRAYDRLYRLSLEEDNPAQQIRCINDLINESHRQQDTEREGKSMVMKVILFYNLDLNDSVYAFVPKVLEFHRQHEIWQDYYQVWTLLVNTYNFAGETSVGLKEVKTMFEDANQRQDQYGMGMAYYAMGNVYNNMYNPDEAANSYRQSINLLMQVKPYPMQLSDIFSYYGDVLESQHNYQELERLTEQWKTFLTDYYAKKDDISDAEANNRWAYYYLARAQAALGLDNLTVAEQDLEEVKNRTVYETGFLYKMWLHYQSTLFLKQDKPIEALALSDQSMRLLSDSDDKAVVIRTHQLRADILERLGRYQEAAALYHRMYTINDSINTNDIKHQLTEMNARFDLDELRLEKQQQQYRNMLIIVGIIISALVIFILFRYRAAKRLKAAHGKLEEAHGQLLVAYDQLEETTTAKERIESELRIARDIQMGMVPQVVPPFPERKDIDLFASMTPAKAVGGDLYDFFLADDKLYFCLGDVSGKGVPASLFMAVAVNLFRVACKQQLPPAEIATQLNGVLAENNENSMFVTMFIGVADLKTGRLDFCNAGHNRPVIKDADGGANFLKMKPNTPLGFWPGMEFEGEYIEDISMRPFFVYSDGLNEAENAEQEQFGDDHLLNLLQEMEYESAEKTIGMMNAEVEKHVKGAEQSDDLTMLCLRIKGNQSSLITN